MELLKESLRIKSNRVKITEYLVLLLLISFFLIIKTFSLYKLKEYLYGGTVFFKYLYGNLHFLFLKE